MAFGKKSLKLPIFTAILALLVSPHAVAQNGPPKWSVGLMMLGDITPYAGEKDELKAIPYISYRGDRLYLNGLEAGYKVVKPARDADYGFGLNAILRARMQPGTSRDKVRADGGVSARFATPYGDLALSFVHDITDSHNGHAVTFGYSYEWERGALTLTPSVELEWQSKALANFVWGLSAQDAAELSAAPYIIADGALTATARLALRYELTDTWTVFAFGGLTRLDSTIRQNPAIDTRYDKSAAIGISYSF